MCLIAVECSTLNRSTQRVGCIKPRLANRGGGGYLIHTHYSISHYVSISDTFTWTWNEECYSSLALAWMTLCQFHTRMEIEYLPVYYPNKLEQADLKLFSRNVQKEMARHLNVPTSDTSVNLILSKHLK